MRPLGVEIELNLIEDNLKETIDYVCCLINNLGLNCLSQGWSYNHNNTAWICKPDSSCGIEVCSPVLKNLFDLKKVLDVFKSDPKIKVDKRCSVHVHFSIEDLDLNALQSVLIWWIKFEHIFMDFADLERKDNQYCRCIGMTDIFDHEEFVAPHLVISKLSNKYLSLNTYHFQNRKRKAIEFRLAEGTKDFEFVFNWVRLLDSFIGVFKDKKIPDNYCWEDPSVFFKFMDFENRNLLEVKKWFINRLVNNYSNDGYWSLENRKNCFKKYKEIENE